MQHDSHSFSEASIELKRRADEAAAEARERNGVPSTTQGGQEMDSGFRLSSDVAEADRVRASDDGDLARRQQDAAEAQRRAAEQLRESGERLRGTAQELSRTAAAVRDSRGHLQELRESEDALREQVAQARDHVQGTEMPFAAPDPEGRP